MMASPTPTKRPMTAPPAEPTGGAALDADALYEILLRVPARDLCRARAVCGPWRSLTSDPLFVRDHAARHTGPLLATVFVHDDDGSLGVCLRDLPSGAVVKRIRTGERGFRLQRTRLDLVCLVGARHHLTVTAFDPATGVARTSSHDISEEYRHLLKRRFIPMESCAVGKVPSTGEYKAFRILRVGTPVSTRHVCEVITLERSCRRRWRATADPPGPVTPINKKIKSVVVNGVAYFLLDFMSRKVTVKPGTIACFDLETEEWTAALDGPKPVTSFYEGQRSVPIFAEHLSITDLNGSLVMVHNVPGISMDLWFLMEGAWIQKYSIACQQDVPRGYPLVVLNDERIIFIIEEMDLLRSYDPKTDSFTDMFELEDCMSIGIYTGSLLSKDGAFINETEISGYA